MQLCRPPTAEPRKNSYILSLHLQHDKCLPSYRSAPSNSLYSHQSRAGAVVGTIETMNGTRGHHDAGTRFHDKLDGSDSPPERVRTRLSTPSDPRGQSLTAVDQATLEAETMRRKLSGGFYVDIKGALLSDTRQGTGAAGGGHRVHQSSGHDETAGG